MGEQEGDVLPSNSIFKSPGSFLILEFKTQMKGS